MLPHFRHILFATDLSDVCRHAMGFAFSMAATFRARLTVLHVMPDLAAELSQRIALDPASLSLSGDTPSLDWLDQEQHATALDIRTRLTALCNDLLAQAAEQDPELTNRLTLLIKPGDPVETVLETAHDGDFDCIVVGSHGQGMVSRLLVGSVAEGVVRASRIPVLVTPVYEEEDSH
ncbi:universal stress protein [Megalodesulfovibrio paquesii]